MNKIIIIFKNIINKDLKFQFEYIYSTSRNFTEFIKKSLMLIQIHLGNKSNCLLISKNDTGNILLCSNRIINLNLKYNFIKQNSCYHISLKNLKNNFNKLIYFKKNKINIIIPCVNKNNLLGFLFIGDKKNNRTYTLEEKELLNKVSLILGKYLIRHFAFYGDTLLSLKYFSKPNLLNNNGLLNLDVINKLSKARNISKVDALREIIKKSILYFKPTQEELEKRTLSKIRYEILSMLAFEEACESQIMWDLGFDIFTRSVNEKMSNIKAPRLKFRTASEYAATSIRSYRRIKKEAVKMLAWRIESWNKI